jgi:hypothetical protein
MPQDYSRSVELLCPTCAGSEFDFDDEVDETVRLYHCAGCGGSFDHEHLMLANSARIDAEVDALGEEVVKDALKKLRKSFEGNRFIELK